MKLNEVFTNWISDGIFKYLNALDVPWKTEVDSDSLNVIYHGSKSGTKTIGALVESLMVNSVLSDNSKSTIAKAIFAIYNKKWEKLYNTLSLEYNPINNYDMREAETTEDKHNGTYTHDGNEIAVNSGNTVISDTNTNQLWGYNSQDAVNSDKQIVDSTQDVSSNVNTTIKNNDTDTKTINGTRTLTRSGNIGVTTSQQMIESERELWMWNFFDIVFADLDNILVLKVYEV